MEPTVDIRTLTGLTMAAAVAMLDEELAPEAYKPVPGAVDLTDIKPAWLTEYLNRVFGISGFGWWFTYAAEDLHVIASADSKGRTIYEAAIDRLEFYYRLIVNGDLIVAGPVLANGGSGNSEREYAVRGALTNALGAAASKLGWQLSVYQDRRGHAGKPRPAQRPAPAVPPRHEAAAPAPSPASNVALTLESARATLFPGGKHKDKTLGAVAQEEPDYIRWTSENAKSPTLRVAAELVWKDMQAQSAVPAAEPEPAVPAAPPATPVKTPPAMTLEQARTYAMPFGTRDHPEYKGQTLGTLIAQDAGFVRWLAENSTNALLRQAATLMVSA